MKKLLTLSICAVLGLSAMAQQLPNNDFEEAWVDCIPWTSKGNTTVLGTTPTSWNVSNTIGTGTFGKTIVGFNVEGYNGSKSAVQVKNGVAANKTIPGYFGLGTSWSTAKGTNGGNKDGGQFGGTEFSYRPDAIQFVYKSEGPTQPTVVAYLWNGTYEQEEVPGNIVVIGNPIKITMVDRDRNILGMETSQGGNVTKEGTKVAVVNSRFEAVATDWTEGLFEFDYFSDLIPEKINVIFAADNYFSSDPTKDNSLTVDDVKLLYYSRLNSLKVADQKVALEDGKYDYTFDFEMPETDEAFVYDLKGKSAEATVTRDEVNHTATIKVSNVDADTDGLKEHNYVLAFAAPVEPVEAEKYDGNVTITIEGAEPIVQSSTIYIEMTGENTCTFRLPNFTLDLGEGPMSLGDIVVPNVQVTEKDGVRTFTGSVKDLILDSADLGEIHAGVTLNGTIDADGNVHMNIPVVWYMDGDVTNKAEDNMIPIDVVFVAKNTPTGVDEIEAAGNGEVEYYNLQGIRVANPESGIYIRRQGSKVSKVYVK